MLRSKALFTADEEHAKKSDDHMPPTLAASKTPWTSWFSAPRVRRRRLLYGLLALLLVYLFVRNMPTDLIPVSQRGDIRLPPLRTPRNVLPGSLTASSTDQPPRPHKPSEADNHYFSGPIKYYRLAATLQSLAKHMGHREVNKNVLFAVSSLRSASEVIPMACEMARWERNRVHFSFHGRDDLSVEDIKDVNGVGSDCEVHWHDARPDFSPWSSDFRMETSVTASLAHIHQFMHPQVIITHDSNQEDTFFTRAVRAKATELRKSVIELPPNAAENLMWITRLDSGSLSAWHKAYVDILIHAPSESSGSLIRLLRSIEAADYFGARRPHLTIELPTDIDPPTRSFLEKIVWPPIDPLGSPHASQVTLRHRIPRKSLTTEEASSTFLESFFPARPRDSHVLVLSPQVELSPLYYHYMMYNLLEYKYSSYISSSLETEKLMGISLEFPSSYLNGSQPFIPPILYDPLSEDEQDEDKDVPTPFLWQAPNSNAALYFGDKWIEIHSFLTARIAASKTQIPIHQRPPPRQKEVSQSYPAWMEYISELIRARGYSLLYPNFPSLSDSIVTVHNELYHPPPEFTHTSETTSSETSALALDLSDHLTADPSAFSHTTYPEPPLLTAPLLSMLPSPGDLPELSSIPLLDFYGTIINPASSLDTATKYADSFRRDIGHCRSVNSAHGAVQRMKTDDLFCKAYEEMDLKAEPRPVAVVEPVLGDESEIRQGEFNAHLARQGLRTTKVDTKTVVDTKTAA